MLEELVLNAGPVTSETTVVVATSVRELAGQLGLSKDTVAAAARRLASAGVTWREDERDGSSGRFRHSRYVVDLTTTGMRLATTVTGVQARASDTAIAEPDRVPTTAAAEVVTPTTRPHPRTRNATTDAQLSLLDPDPNPT